MNRAHSGVNPIKLYSIDREIINLLQQDGRMSATEISKHLPGVSPRVVRYRINRLREMGVISVLAIINPKPLGYEVMADVMVETEPAKTAQIIEALVQLDLIRYVAYTGDRDISIQIVTRTVEDLHTFIHDSVQTLSGVIRTRTYLLPDTSKFTYQWKIPAEITDDADSSRPAASDKMSAPTGPKPSASNPRPPPREME